MMSTEGVVNVKYRILDLFTDLNEDSLSEIEKWICSQSYRKDLENKRKLLKQEKSLIKIGDVIKKQIPLEGELSSEIIAPPTVGDQADCNKNNTYHVDEFLYDHEQLERLVQKGKVKRHYCVDCNSRNIKNLTFISHSMSRQVLQYIFKVLLPSELEGQQILDIGSRLGGVLYSAYYFTNISSIIGIEMNKECCEIQDKVIDQFSLDRTRLKVINADVMEKPDIVTTSDIIIMNVLDFFVDTEKHRQMWYFFKKHMKKGAYLVLNRSVAETLGALEIFSDMMNWLTVCRPNQLENEIYFDIEDCSELYLYVVN